MSGCKKSSNGVCYVIYHFTYTGSPCVNEAVTFRPALTGSCSFFWNFGDGTTSKTAIPVHQYADTGTYKVSLVINNDTAHIVDSIITILYDPQYTHLVTRMRTWHHSWHEYLSGGYSESSFNDTSFQVNYVNAVVVSVFGNDLTYFPSLSHDSTLVFTYQIYNPAGGMDYGSYSLYFNYISNSITYSDIIQWSPGGSTSDNYTTP